MADAEAETLQAENQKAGDDQHETCGDEETSHVLLRMPWDAMLREGTERVEFTERYNCIQRMDGGADEITDECGEPA